MFVNNFRWGLVSYRNHKLICEANQCNGSCVMRFLPKGYSEQTMILHLCGSGKYTPILRFSIRGSEARVLAPFGTWSVQGFLERCLMCYVITGLGCIFTLIQMRLSDVKKIS